VQAARALGAGQVIAVDTVPSACAMAETFGATAVHLTEQDPKAAVRKATSGRGADACIEAVGHPDALDLACRLARNGGTISVTGVYSERCQVHMGIVWIKALTLTTGQANVSRPRRCGARDDDRGPRRPDAARQPSRALAGRDEAYAAYARREALKIVLTP
jgi:threonine dehydrogenase-like Zn-dependent dehydrogenase